MMAHAAPFFSTVYSVMMGSVEKQKPRSCYNNYCYLDSPQQRSANTSVKTMRSCYITLINLGAINRVE